MIFQTKDRNYHFSDEGRLITPCIDDYELDLLKPVLEDEGLYITNELSQLRWLSTPCYNAMLFMREGLMGTFAGKIAEAWFYADDTNRSKIETAFFDLIYRAVKAQGN